jgi:hypothetical protein
MWAMPDLQHVLKSYPLADLVDEIASANPPAFLRRCFAEGVSAPHLSWARVQELAGCALVLDAVVAGRDDGGIEPELVADWHAHYGAEFARLKSLAAQALGRAAGPDAPAADADALAELRQLREHLTGS